MFSKEDLNFEMAARPYLLIIEAIEAHLLNKENLSPFSRSALSPQGGRAYYIRPQELLEFIQNLNTQASPALIKFLQKQIAERNPRSESSAMTY